MEKLSHEALNAVLTEMAHQQGHALNAQDRLILRTRITASLAAKERHRQRMNAASYQWKKPGRLRR
jgi:hypothetical protein